MFEVYFKENGNPENAYTSYIMRFSERPQQ